MPRAGGREELRANLLKPYLLRLRSVKDDAAVRAIMSLAGIPLSVIEDETGWISVAAARRALGAIEDALGAGVLTRRDTWLTHPENLGTYVRMLRSRDESRSTPIAFSPIPGSGEPHRRVRSRPRSPRSRCA